MKNYIQLEGERYYIRKFVFKSFCGIISILKQQTVNTKENHIQ